MFDNDQYLCNNAFFVPEAAMRSGIQPEQSTLEEAAKALAPLPHYKYVARPFYKLCGGGNIPLFSVPATAFFMDMIFHQLPISVAFFIINQLNKKPGEKVNFFKIEFPKTRALGTLFYLCLNMVIALRKHKRLQEENTVKRDNIR